MECFEWRDEHQHKVVGWIVVDSMINGCASGRLHVSSSASKEECAFRAAQASLSNSIAHPHVGGAAAMIKIDDGLDVAGTQKVITSFLIAHSSLLANTLVLLGATDTATAFIDAVCKSLKLSGAQHAFSHLFAKETGQKDYGKHFGPVMRWVSFETSLSDLAHSFAICQIMRCLSEAFLHGRPRIIISGFGFIGSSIAYWVEKQCIGVVVAVVDVEGSISLEGGLPVAEILSIRSAALAKRCSLGQSLSEKAWSTENILCNLNEAQSSRFNASTQDLCLEAEFLVICDGAKAARALKFVSSAAFVVPAFDIDGHHLFSPDLFKELETRSMAIVPRWVCTAGKEQAARSIVTLSMDFEALERVAVIRTVLDSICAPLTVFLQEACSSLKGQRPSNIATACESMARDRMANSKPFTVVKQDQKVMDIAIFVDAASLQEKISQLMVAVRLLFRTLFRNHNDAILLEMLEDLIVHVLTPKLQHVYCSEDMGERKSKVLFLRLLNGVQSFLKTYSSARSSGGDITLIMRESRSSNFQSEPEAARAFLEHFELPFKSSTLMLILEQLISTGTPLIILEKLLRKAIEKESPMAQSDPSVKIEEHKSEFGRVVGGIVCSVCEMAGISFVHQAALRVFLFFGGGYFLGGIVDQKLEPDIDKDIELVATLINIITACQDASNEDEPAVSASIVTLLRILVPILDAEKLGPVLVEIVANPVLVRELTYFHVMPAMLAKE